MRYGPGVTSEVGMDFANMTGVERVCLVTDQTMVNLPPVSANKLVWRRGIILSRCHGAVIFDVFEPMPCNWQLACDNRDFAVILQ